MVRYECPMCGYEKKMGVEISLGPTPTHICPKCKIVMKKESTRYQRCRKTEMEDKFVCELCYGDEDVEEQYYGPCRFICKKCLIILRRYNHLKVLNDIWWVKLDVRESNKLIEIVACNRLLLKNQSPP